MLQWSSKPFGPATQWQTAMRFGKPIRALDTDDKTGQGVVVLNDSSTYVGSGVRVWGRKFYPAGTRIYSLYAIGESKMKPKLKIRIHERFELTEASYSGPRNDIFYNVLKDELGRLNRKDVSNEQIRLFADNNYKDFYVQDIINEDAEELNRAIRKLDDYLSTASNSKPIGEALKPLESLLTKTINAFATATGKRPNPDTQVGKYYGVHTGWYGVASDDAEDGRYAEFTASKESKELILRVKSIGFDGALGSIEFKASVNFDKLNINTAKPFNSTLLGVADASRIRVAIKYYDPLTKKDIKLNRVPTAKDLQNVKLIYSMDSENSKTTIVPRIYIYNADSSGVSGCHAVFVVANNESLADKRMKAYVEANPTEVFSNYGDRWVIWKEWVIDNATLKNNVLVYKGAYDNGDINYINLKNNAGTCKTKTIALNISDCFPNGVEKQVDVEEQGYKNRWTYKNGQLMTNDELNALSNSNKAKQDKMHVKSVYVYEFSYRTWVFKITAIDDSGNTYQFTPWYSDLDGYDKDKLNAFVPSSNLGREISSLLSSGKIKLKDGWEYYA